jgi:hypothetical protein
MPIDLEHGAFEPEATAAMGEAFEACAKSFTTSASANWCANSSPNELLRLQAKVSLTRFAYGERR